MEEPNYKFEIPKHHKSIIKVIGVGGGGSNAVNHMYDGGIKDVEFIVCNTDVQALKNSPVPNKLQIGVSLTDGLGAGANPERGKDAALESKEEIRELLSQDTRMVFITAGMGGGTGTGAAPVIARVAREMDILTVGIVTAPFAFEGKKKMKLAQEGIRELKANCDTVLVILNDNLNKIYGNLGISKAFAQADNILTTASKGIAEIITVHGYVNVDFEDVNTVMKNSGAAVMGAAETNGENRAIRAAEGALCSPLLDNKNIHGAKKILLSIISGEEAELQLNELTEITDYIEEIAGYDAEVIFGHGIDPELGESIRVTVIATGFDEEAYQQPVSDTRKVYDLESSKQIGLFDGKRIEAEEKPVENWKREDAAPVDEVEEPIEETPVANKGYSFEGSVSNATEENEAGQSEESREYLFELEKEFEIVEKEPEANNSVANGQDKENFELDHKKQMLEMKARERADKLRGLKSPSVSTDEFKEKLEVPAYLRKKVRLDDVKHSSEHNVSRYNLNDDNQILGNNKYLHDRPD